MALTHSPKIVTDGLVFAYDMGNPQKSWRGAPTTNYLSAGTSGFTAFTSGGWNGTSMPQVGTSEFNTPIFSYNTSLVVYVYTNDNVLSDDYAALSGQPVTFSLYLRRVEGPATAQIRVYDNVSGYSYQTVSATQEFQRFQMTKTIGVSPTRIFVMIDNTGGGTYQLHSTQLDLGTFATPFVNGTRSNTQAVLDLINNNTITANSLTYNSDNTFSFNGSTNRMSTNNASQLTDFTIGVWFKALGNTGGYDRIVDKLYTTGTMLMRNASSANSWGGGVLESSPPYGRFLTLTDGRWHYLVSIRSGTTHTLYGDGITNTVSGTVANTALNTVSFGIGSWYDGATTQYFNGQIPQVSIYNRALTASEVAQNFNALRGRYGV